MEKFKTAKEVLEETRIQMHNDNCQSWNTICLVAMEKWCSQFLDFAIQECKPIDNCIHLMITEDELEEIKEQSLKLNI